MMYNQKVQDFKNKKNKNYYYKLKKIFNFVHKV